MSSSKAIYVVVLSIVTVIFVIFANNVSHSVPMCNNYVFTAGKGVEKLVNVDEIFIDGQRVVVHIEHTYDDPSSFLYAVQMTSAKMPSGDNLKLFEIKDGIVTIASPVELESDRPCLRLEVFLSFPPNPVKLPRLRIETVVVDDESVPFYNIPWLDSSQGFAGIDLGDMTSSVKYFPFINITATGGNSDGYLKASFLKVDYFIVVGIASVIDKLAAETVVGAEYNYLFTFYYDDLTLGLVNGSALIKTEIADANIVVDEKWVGYFDVEAVGGQLIIPNDWTVEIFYQSYRNHKKGYVGDETKEEMKYSLTLDAYTPSKEVIIEQRRLV
eukprot:TRINITY_DN340_c0_g1_i1.p1 TRINITY_DN340_c0_g1~~TRINITY_DN340_c0_g1_i1.p1  ORF type:complete len:328 (+),score=45.39 TRINITY_DN340_c0_g1_i1:78-1061(+)